MMFEQRAAWQGEQLVHKRAEIRERAEARQRRSEYQRIETKADLKVRSEKRRQLAAQQASNVANRSQKWWMLLGQLMFQIACVAPVTLATWFYGKAWPHPRGAAGPPNQLPGPMGSQGPWAHRYNGLRVPF